MNHHRRTRRTSEEVQAALDELASAFGGDYVARRAANALVRTGVVETFDDLKKLAAEEGEENFRYRITDLRNVGAATACRILAAIYPTET